MIPGAQITSPDDKFRPHISPLPAFQEDRNPHSALKAIGELLRLTPTTTTAKAVAIPIETEQSSVAISAFAILEISQCPHRAEYTSSHMFCEKPGVIGAENQSHSVCIVFLK